MNEETMFEGKSVSELATELGAVKAIKERAAQREQEIRRELEPLLDPGESRNIMFGTTVAGQLNMSRGSNGKGLTVKDKLAYAQYLVDRYQDAAPVYPIPYPSETALSRSYLDRIVSEAGGAEVDEKGNLTNVPGLVLDTGRSPSITTRLDKTIIQQVWQQAELPRETRVLLEQGGEL